MPVFIGHGSFHAVLKLRILRIVPQRELFYQLVLFLGLLPCHVKLVLQAVFLENRLLQSSLNYYYRCMLTWSF